MNWTKLPLVIILLVAVALMSNIGPACGGSSSDAGTGPTRGALAEGMYEQRLLNAFKETGNPIFLQQLQNYLSELRQEQLGQDFQNQLNKIFLPQERQEQLRRDLEDQLRQNTRLLSISRACAKTYYGDPRAIQNCMKL